MPGHYKVLHTAFSCNLSHHKCCIASCDYLLHVLPPPRKPDFLVAKSRNQAYFLQHENLLITRGVGNTPKKNRNLQRNVCCAINFMKALPVLLGRYEILIEQKIGWKHSWCKVCIRSSNTSKGLLFLFTYSGSLVSARYKILHQYSGGFIVCLFVCFFTIVFNLGESSVFLLESSLNDCFEMQHFTPKHHRTRLRSRNLIGMLQI